MRRVLLSRIEALEQAFGTVAGPTLIARELDSRGFKATAHPLVLVVESAPGLDAALKEIEAKHPEVASTVVAIIRDLATEDHSELNFTDVVPTGDGPPLWSPFGSLERRTVRRQATSGPEED